jgi:hypothetical protein
MSFQEPFQDRTLAISISDAPDMPALGLSKLHLEDAMAEVARHMLALGADLAYGGDLRPGGFSEVLFELIARHRRGIDEDDDDTGIYNYLAWPVHIEKSQTELDQMQHALAGVAQLMILDIDGSEMTPKQRLVSRPHAPSAAEWEKGLTSMRHTMVDDTDARVALGGRMSGYMGAMPGIAEEALITIRERQPLYLLGGFGGCARSLAEAIRLIPKWAGSQSNWAGYTSFQRLTYADLNNGLNEDENKTLARTPHVDQAVTLIMRGLSKVWV